MTSIRKKEASSNLGIIILTNLKQGKVSFQVALDYHNLDVDDKQLDGE